MFELGTHGCPFDTLLVEADEQNMGMRRLLALYLSDYCEMMDDRVPST